MKSVFRPASGQRALAILAGAARALYEAKDHVTTITLNRPDRLNAISGPMLESFSQALRTPITTQTCE